MTEERDSGEMRISGGVLYPPGPLGEIGEVLRNIEEWGADSNCDLSPTRMAAKLRSAISAWESERLRVEEVAKEMEARAESIRAAHGAPEIFHRTIRLWTERLRGRSGRKETE